MKSEKTERYVIIECVLGQVSGRTHFCYRIDI